eukprot:TRINITY_DN33855_c0_g1_i2.p1 TRINITY_DN33855_c0_g1~~TRINITY_DN33855_c0_g1_i2.p1  ORF type:complete len:136 (-),score=27.38 TRINITY_DN33855_c0_g1_i2:95-502(-)
MPSVQLLRACLAAIALPAAVADLAIVTGATGRTGTAIYKALQAASSDGLAPRALVRNATKAKEVLGCTTCDEKDGIYIGDVTDKKTLAAAFEGVTTLAIAVGVYGTEPREIVKNVEWLGVKNQVETLLAGGAAGS